MQIQLKKMMNRQPRTTFHRPEHIYTNILPVQRMTIAKHSRFFPDEQIFVNLMSMDFYRSSNQVYQYQTISHRQKNSFLPCLMSKNYLPNDRSVYHAMMNSIISRKYAIDATLAKRL